MNNREWRMRFSAATLALAGSLLVSSTVYAAGGYYYEANSFYVAPPVFQYGSLFARPPVLIYPNGPPPATPPLGFFSELPPAPVRYRERLNVTPNHTGYRYRAVVPGGPDHRVRYQRNGSRTTVRETWGY